MNKVSRILASGFACCAAFAQAAMAGGMAYTPDPVIEDGGSDAGLFLLLAVGALLLIRAVNNPQPAKPADDASDTTE
jgi:hypothetical protein